MTPSARIPPRVPVNGRPLSLVGAPETPDKTPGRARPEEDHWTHIQPKLKAPQPPSSDVITFPRTAVGLNTLYQAIARDFPEAVRMSRGHWECNTQHTATRLTSIVGKDQYESPWSVVSVLKEKEGIDFDACATPFSAVSPNASVNFNHCHQIIPIASRPRATPYVLDHSFHLPIQPGRRVKISVLMSCTPRVSQ